jgi:hypothetical protein
MTEGHEAYAKGLCQISGISRLILLVRPLGPCLSNPCGIVKAW